MDYIQGWEQLQERKLWVERVPEFALFFWSGITTIFIDFDKKQDLVKVDMWKASVHTEPITEEYLKEHDKGNTQAI